MRTVPIEADIQKAIMDYFAAERIPAIRYNTGAFVVDGRLIRANSAGQGHPDIVAWPVATYDLDKAWDAVQMRRTVFVEVKAPGGKQSSSQKTFQKWATDNNLDYLLADSLDVVIQWVEEHR